MKTIDMIGLALFAVGAIGITTLLIGLCQWVKRLQAQVDSLPTISPDLYERIVRYFPTDDYHRPAHPPAASPDELGTYQPAAVDEFYSRWRRLPTDGDAEP